MWVRACVIVWIGCVVGVSFGLAMLFGWWTETVTPVELCPVQIETVPVEAVVETIVEEPRWTDAELEFVMRVVMSEARGEPTSGMRGVAQTIRDRSVGWGLDVIEVLTAENQFAGAFDGEISDEVRQAVIDIFVEGESEFDCLLTHFHADYVTPYWSNSKVYVGSRGGTRFYTSK